MFPADSVLNKSTVKKCLKYASDDYILDTRQKRLNCPPKAKKKLASQGADYPCGRLGNEFLYFCVELVNI